MMFSRPNLTMSELERSAVNKDLKKWGSPGRKQRWQLLTDTDGIGVWPNVSSWMRGPRSKQTFAMKV